MAIKIVRRLTKRGQVVFHSVKYQKHHFGVELKQIKENHYRIRMDNRQTDRIDTPFNARELDLIIKSIKENFERLEQPVREIHQKQHGPDYELQLDVFT